MELLESGAILQPEVSAVALGDDHVLSWRICSLRHWNIFTLISWFVCRNIDKKRLNFLNLFLDNFFWWTINYFYEVAKAAFTGKPQLPQTKSQKKILLFKHLESWKGPCHEIFYHFFLLQNALRVHNESLKNFNNCFEDRKWWTISWHGIFQKDSAFGQQIVPSIQ